jgi:repressor LexA
VSRIAAGRGLEAVAVGDEAYSLAAELLLPSSGKQRYLLRVVGQSMVEARIEEGDLLVVEEDEDPPDGTVVVALLKGEEATVKRLLREGEKVRLRAQNGGHEDIVIPAEDVKVQGRVVYVLHPPGE